MCADCCVEFLSVNDSEIRGMHSSPLQRTSGTEEEGNDPTVLYCLTLSHSASLRLTVPVKSWGCIIWPSRCVLILCLYICRQQGSVSLLAFSWEIP